jgi:hypothetical protein
MKTRAGIWKETIKAFYTRIIFEEVAKDMRKLRRIADYRVGNQNEDIPDGLATLCDVRFQPDR